jgi:hypothetical protein
VDKLIQLNIKDTKNMSQSFADLKRSRKSLYDKILEETNKIQQPEGKQEDNRFWTPSVDKAGNGYAVIRFLPAPKGEDIPWVRLFSHGFQGPGGWFIENSLTTLNKKDPVSEYNSTLWNRGDEAGKEQARKQKRRLTYMSNIYVVKDPANPDNDGKVFLFRYGKKLFDKINDIMNPEFEDESPVNPFDLWEGANFKMKIRNLEGYRNYDKSEFDKPTPLSEDEETLERVWSSEHSLNEFLDPKNFKSYNELKMRLDKVLGSVAVSSTASEYEEDEPVVPKSTPSPEAIAKTESSGDDLDFFKKLADD